MSNSTTLVEHSLTGDSFGYSAADLGDLGATEYTLVTIAVDKSSSVAEFETEMEKCIQEIIKACKYSPRSDYLLIRLVAFNRSMDEIHGFKQLVDCELSDYDGCLKVGGSTLLFETARNAISSTADYAKDLVENEFDVNAIVFILTDGMDNESGSIDADSVGQALQQAMRDEKLESILSILIGVGVGKYAGVSDYLNEFKTDAALSQYVEIKDANDQTLAKLADFISKSVSSQSNSIGTGGPSQTLQF
ncbi:MAG: hypothetical protein ACTSSP_01810 [Candidatus Asgardarchaeia archaeon]